MSDEATPKRLVIVSGLSGSGKSTALHALEDLGYYCVDNLPIALLAALGRQLTADGPEGRYQRAAVGVDVRNMSNLAHFPDLVGALDAAGIETHTIFLTTEVNTLIKRFNESRRPHPLAGDGRTIAEAIALERERLTPVSESAARLIDTTQTTIYELRELIRALDDSDTSALTLIFQSFGYKHGSPMDADLVFDMRCLPNPNWQTDLRDLTGLDRKVGAFLEQHPLVEEMYCSTRDYLARWIPHHAASSRSYLNVAVGCTGGRHRSVYMTERLGHWFRDSDHPVIIRHRQLAGRGDSTLTEASPRA